MLRCFLGSVQRKKSVREKKVVCPCVFVWACVTDLNLREGVATESNIGDGREKQERDFNRSYTF